MVSNGSQGMSNTTSGTTTTRLLEEGPELESPRAAPRRREWRTIYVTLAVSLLLGLVSGTLYGYGRYSMDLKRTLDLSHFELQLLGILLDTGNYIGHPVVGYIYDHYGPRVSCLTGAVVVFGAFGTIHWIISGGFMPPSSTVVPNTSNTSSDQQWWIWWYVLCASFFGVGLGSGLGYTAALGSTTKKFQAIPQYRNLGVGIVASGYGFCSTLVGVSYQALGRNLSHFFLFWALLVASVNLLGAMVFPAQQNTVTDTVDSGDTLLVDTVEPEEGGSDTLQEGENEELLFSRPNENDPLEQQGDRLDRGASEMAMPLDLRQPRWAAVRLLDFWILFAIFACCTGCGLFVINNISTMVQSLGGNDTMTGRLVILFSISNCVGRILVGSLADRPNVNKLVLFGVAGAAMAGSLLLNATVGSSFHNNNDNNNNKDTSDRFLWETSCLDVTVFLVAIAYGGSWVLVIGILSDWFGTPNFGKNYGIMAMGPALSGMLFNSASAWMYERQASSSSSSGTSEDEDATVCLGTACYRGSFFLTGLASLLSLILLGFLASRRKCSIATTSPHP